MISISVTADNSPRFLCTVVMFFQYYICKFPLFSTKYVINILNNIGVFAIKCAKSSAHIIFVSFVKKESYRLNREKKIGDASQITTYL